MIYTRNLGIPLFHSSFDFYCFLVGLMSNIDFYNSVTNDEELLNIWESIWIKEEYDDVKNNIKNLGNDFESIIKFISKYHLRCNCVNYVWSKFK